METRITPRVALLILFDIIATAVAYSLGAVLTGQTQEILSNTDVLFAFGGLAVINVVVYSVFHLYNRLWEYASIDEMFEIIIATLIAGIIGSISLFVIGERYPIRVFVASVLLYFFFASSIRFVLRYGYRMRKLYRERAPKEKRPRTLIIGAGETGSMTIKRMLTGDYAMQGIPIVAVDDNPAKQGVRIHGVKVMGDRNDILSLVKKHNITQIVVAIPSASAEDRRAIFAICSETDCKLLTLPDVKDLRMSELEGVTLREVNVADLLGRDEIVLDTALVAGYLAGRTILVTGGSGSIGGELARQLYPVHPKRIVLFDMFENGAFDLRGELMEHYGESVEVIVEIGSICDQVTMRRIFERYQPQVVFHAAAHKHVPLMEICPQEALKNNVFGTRVLAQTAGEYGVERFIFISTDKAVNPVNAMGCTKRLGEMIIQALNTQYDTVYTAVRFGNVLGSNGSVIPIFKRQIADGGPLRVTHPDITRYFMTIPEASRLVIEAGGLAEGGEIFILDMGEPVKIMDLARNIIRLSGLTEGEDIDIEIVGLRPGEKLYEELLMDSESTIPTKVKDIMISRGQDIDPAQVVEHLQELESYLDAPENEVKKALARAVPTYKPQL